MPRILQHFAALLFLALCPLAVADTCAVPVVTNLHATSNAAGTQVTFTWDTNIPADSLVSYGLGLGGLVSPVTDVAGVTTGHSVVVGNYLPGRTSSWGYRTRPIVSGVPCDPSFYKFGGGPSIQPPSLTVTTSPQPAGSYDYQLLLLGAKHVTQGYGLYVQVTPARMVGSAPGLNIQKLTVTGLPPHASVYWPDQQTLGQAGTRSTVTSSNDTLTWYQVQTTQVQINTNVGGTTPPGSYTLTFTSSGTGLPTHTATWDFVVNDVSTNPFGYAFTAGTPGSYPAIPHLTEYLANASTYGAYNCAQDLDISPRTIRANDNANLTPVSSITKSSWFYDGVRVYNNVSKLLEDYPTWDQCRSNIKAVYRDGYIIPNNGAVLAFNMFTRGAYEDYRRTGDALNLTQIDKLDLHTYNPANGFLISPNPNQRETAYSLDSDLYASLLGRNNVRYGHDTTYWLQYHLDQVLSQVDMICLDRNAEYFEYFMAGLDADALISYYELKAHDPRIPPAIKCLADRLYEGWNAVTRDPGAFPYDSVQEQINQVGSSRVQLNLLIAPMFAWTFKMTGDATYQSEGDDIWTHGVLNDGALNNGPGFMGSLNAYPGGSAGKFFSQNYMWSADYVVWRSSPAPEATPSPATLDFGNQKTTVQSAPHAITLTNTGTGTLNIASIALTTGTEFALGTNTCGSTLAPDASCTVSPTFTPASIGTKTDGIVFTDDGPDSPQTVPLTGNGTASIVNLFPTSLSFGSLLVGQSSSAQVVTLRNTGNITLNITSIASNSVEFPITTSCGSTLAAGSTCTISATFHPLSTGAKSGGIVFTDDASDSPQTLPLTGTCSGTAIQYSILGVQTSSVEFPTRFITTTGQQVLTLTNLGAGILNISGISLSGDSAFTKSTNCGATLAVAASCSITLNFTPPTADGFSGTLSVADDAPDSPQSIAISGSGVLPVGATTLDAGSGSIDANIE